MRKIGSILLTLCLFVGLCPNVSSAAQNPNFDQKLKTYVTEISKIRGFDVSQEDIEFALYFYDKNLEDFTSFEEVRALLGDPIKADLSNLNTIYEIHGLDQKSLFQLLEEYGDDVSYYIFVNELKDSVAYYIDEQSFERDQNFDKDLVTYLEEISNIRGFDVTIEDIEKSLALYEDSLESFEKVNELRSFLGDTIKADLSNLDYFMEYYELDKEALLQLLKENDDAMDNYIFIDDLEQSVMMYTGKWPLETDEEMVIDLLLLFQEEFDLTDEELQRLDEHLMSIENELAQPETLEKLENLAYRMMDFVEFEHTTELTEEQIAQLISIYHEFLDIFHLKASYSLVKDGSETPLSITDLFGIQELENAKLKITLFNLEGDLLADLIITGAMVDSETINVVGEKVNEAAKSVTEYEKPISKTVEHKTIKGGKLPKTATPYAMNAFLGLLIMVLGIYFYRIVKKA
ncbi:processed acidic surface protein [Virgibacillus flavescens]|uniref:processed acidic surface protein n=1 Tax=Virgibacillus flavescens TaxID=1611422 RepID=UPI003D33895B